MKKATTLILALIAFINSYAQQVVVYTSHYEYENNKGTKYTGEINYRPNFVSGRNNNNYQPYLQIKEGKEKNKVDIIDAWGFKYKGILFKRDTVSNLFFALLSEGKVYYWENAIILFKELDDVWYNTQNVDYGKGVFISTDINAPSQYYVLDKKKATGSTYTSKYNKLFEMNPTLQSFLDCIDENKKNVTGFKKVDNVTAFLFFTDCITNTKWRNILRKCIKTLNGNFNSAVTIE